MNDSDILIIGANGQLGTALKVKYPGARAVDSNELDITNQEALEAFDWSGVKTILNTAAYTNVDGAESPEGRVSAWKVNAQAVGYLSKIALKHDITIVHVSTEYVFDGTQNPHSEDEPLSPLGVYAQSKAAGDIAASVLPKYYIVRTSWVIGNGKNFVRTMLGLGQQGVDPSVIADDIGRPTFTVELVRAVDHLLSHQAPYGTYNISNAGEPVSWANLTRAIFQLAKLDRKVTDTTNAKYYADKPGASPRPHNSVFDLKKIQSTGFVPRDWKDDLADYINKEVPQ
ncbi:MAG TPA: NAD(P)-dependent oxidoreductase [Candidatus Saccharimonadales bacterium]|jgi:dTDP-4-dehydrorhamnose 3,5-epimerase|nr:NAD(P)-dependent oxidoreductase [Candidatus Saccharimonadales bacterium]